MTEKYVIMYGWNGCLVNTVPQLADMAADCIYKHFETSKERSRNRYLETMGIPFNKQLMEMYPIYTQKHKDCANAFKHMSDKFYKNVLDFPETEKTLKVISNNFIDFVQVISSCSEERLIESWATKHNLMQYIFRIYGYEHGHKNMHISTMKKMFPESKIVFVSSSARDMKLQTDYRVGVNVQESGEYFVEQGANAVIRGPITAKDITLALCNIL